MALLTDVIQHFVVLMLENRSYDQMLGGLADPKYVGVRGNVELPYRGPAGLSSIPLSRGAPPDRFEPDPKHGYGDVLAQIYGAPPPQEEANMAGFVSNFYERQLLRDNFHEDREQRLREFLTIYAEGRLPVLHTLAKGYGVCTHWFSSLPSLTSPNRAFAHAGTSGGETGQATLRWLDLIGGKTIFDLLPNNAAAWRVYHSGPPHLWLMGDKWIFDKRNNFRPIGQFDDDIRNNSLPTYTFIEPRHYALGQIATSQHPPLPVSAGEALIARVYNGLLANFELFKKTLLLIVYDEHGGFYDHVVPPGHKGWADGPHLPHEVIPPENPPLRDATRFGFNQLGVRVPAVIVSPWIEAGTTVGWEAADPAQRRTFDHTSILATVQRLVPDRDLLRHSLRAQAAAALDLPGRAAARSQADCPTLSPAAHAMAAGVTSSGAGLGTSEAAPSLAATPVHSSPTSGPEKELLDAWAARGHSRNWQELEAHVQKLMER